MKKGEKLNVKIISTDDIGSAIKRTKRGEFQNYDEVIVGNKSAVKKFVEILNGLDDNGKPIKNKKR